MPSHTARSVCVLVQPSVRKQHDSGYKHKANVRAYYSQFEQEQTQNLIDEKVKQYEAGACFPICLVGSAQVF